MQSHVLDNDFLKILRFITRFLKNLYFDNWLILISYFVYYL